MICSLAPWTSNVEMPNQGVGHNPDPIQAVALAWIAVEPHGSVAGISGTSFFQWSRMLALPPWAVT